MVSQKINFLSAVGRTRRMEIVDSTGVQLKITNKYAGPDGTVSFEATLIGCMSQINDATKQIREAENRSRDWLKHQKIQRDYQRQMKRVRTQDQYNFAPMNELKNEPKSKKSYNMFAQLNDPSVKNLGMEPYIGSDEYNHKKANSKSKSTANAKKTIAQAGVFEPLNLNDEGMIVSKTKSFCWADLV